MLDDRFTHTSYLIRRKVFKLFGAAFHIYDPQGALAFYSKMKAFKLKEDIRLYADETMTRPLLVIQARQIIDFSAAYDVYDPQGDELVGALRRKGMKSLIRDEWLVLDAKDQQIGLVREDSTGLALLRRFLEVAALIFPQRYHVEVAGAAVCMMKQNFNPFVRKIHVDFGPDTEAALDPRLGIAAAVLMCAVEGKQS